MTSDFPRGGNFPWFDRYVRLLRNAFTAFLFLLLLCHLLTQALNLAPPYRLLRLALEIDPPSRRALNFDSIALAGVQKITTLPQRLRPLTLPIQWRDGQEISLQDFLKRTHTNALLVFHQDALVYSYYAPDVQPETTLPSFSLSKSIMADMLQLAISQEIIGSLQDSVSLYLPMLDPAWNQVRLDDLLNMRSRIPVPEQYDIIFSRIARMYVSTDLDAFIHSLPKSEIYSSGQFDYRSINYLVLGRVLHAASGLGPAKYLEGNIWEALGAGPAYWSVDSRTRGVEKSFCCLQVRAEDFARYGLMRLNGGKFQGNQILPAHLAKRPRATAHANSDFDYGYGWWIPRRTPERGDYLGLGIHGQYLYIDPANDSVIVKLSDHGSEEDEALTVEALRRIAAHAGKV